MEPDYQNNYQDELHLDDEVYEIKSDRINPEYLNNPPRRKRGNAERVSVFDVSYKLKIRIEHERRTIGSHLWHS